MMTMRNSFAGLCAAALVTLPAFAEGAPPRTITVAGHGEVNAAPDSAVVSAGVTTQAKTAAAALDDNSVAMNRVFAVLKRLGVEAKHIQTSNFTVAPQFTPYANNANGQRIVGYQVSNQVDVTLDRTTNVGPAVDALVAAGANQMNGIGFTIRDPKPFLASARAAAVEDAATRAQIFAKAAHVALGPILSIEEGSAVPVRPLYPMRVSAALMAPTPVAAGEQTVAADVTIVWEIQ
jgi:uncharacterized protein YggE